MKSDIFDFTGRTAIITGAASGMGRLTAAELAQRGARVMLTDINADEAAAAAAELTAAGLTAESAGVDVRDFDQIEAAVLKTVSCFGSVDILVNAAGGASTRVLKRNCDFKVQDIDCLEWGIDVNLKGPILFSRAVIGRMINQKRGVIVNLGSVVGVTGSARNIDYSAAKSGIIGLTKALALYGAPHGVRAVCVSPGPVLTRPGRAGMKTLLGRAAEPIEIVDLIVYLCSDRAAFVTGTNFSIDGGRSCAIAD